jgi:uncharacterized membrane protein
VSDQETFVRPFCKKTKDADDGTVGENILSCLAALQAPVIMMSQNRAQARDRLQAENDYKVNLKAELEIRHLHEKVDHLLRRQYQRLFEIQPIQIESPGGTRE